MFEIRLIVSASTLFIWYDRPRDFEEFTRPLIAYCPSFLLLVIPSIDNPSLLRKFQQIV